MKAYYNEFDPNAAEWIRELIKDGLITPGEVDERSIKEVQPDDLRGFDRVHFFAGIAGWDHALNLAGWGDRSVWTGSCPCQPFSSAGKQKGQADERHLWPEFFRLIKACKPETIFGEQVASPEVVGSSTETAFLIAVQSGDFARANKLAKQLARSSGFHYWRRWVDGVQADLGSAGYALRFSVLGAHSVGAPHKRQRLWFMANATGSGRERGPSSTGEARRVGVESSHGIMEHATSNGRKPRRAKSDGRGIASGCGTGGVANAGSIEQRRLPGDEREAIPASRSDGQDDRATGTVAHAGHGIGCTEQGHELQERDSGPRQPGPWDNYELIPCRDGKVRRIKRGIAPLAPRLSDSVVSSSDQSAPPTEEEAQASAEGRVMRLKGYGNAIIPQVAAMFIMAATPPGEVKS